MKHLEELIATELDEARSGLADTSASPSLLAFLSLEPATISRLAEYASLLATWTKRIDLVSADSPEEVIREHFTDCLLARAYLFSEINVGQLKGTLLDVGSGGGLPGLVWACCEPVRRFCLCEPRERRGVFLKEARAALELSNVDVLVTRLESTNADMVPGVEIAVTRALGLKEMYLDYASRLVSPGGVVCFLTGESFRLPALGVYPNLKLRNEIRYLVGRDRKPRKLVMLNVSRETYSRTD